MLLTSLTVDRREFETGTGWTFEPQGACRGDLCVPLRSEVGLVVDVASVADQLGLPLVEDAEHELWALGPWSGNDRTLTSAAAPDLVLPDLAGNDFDLASLRGTKVLLVAWAPY